MAGKASIRTMPPEIMALIGAFSDHESLKALSGVSKSFRLHFGRLLFHNVHIRGESPEIESILPLSPAVGPGGQMINVLQLVRSAVIIVDTGFAGGWLNSDVFGIRLAEFICSMTGLDSLWLDAQGLNLNQQMRVCQTLGVSRRLTIRHFKTSDNELDVIKNTAFGHLQSIDFDHLLSPIDFMTAAAHHRKVKRLSVNSDRRDRRGAPPTIADWPLAMEALATNFEHLEWLVIDKLHCRNLGLEAARIGPGFVTELDVMTNALRGLQKLVRFAFGVMEHDNILGWGTPELGRFSSATLQYLGQALPRVEDFWMVYQINEWGCRGVRGSFVSETESAGADFIPIPEEDDEIDEEHVDVGEFLHLSGVPEFSGDNMPSNSLIIGGVDLRADNTAKRIKFPLGLWS